LPIDLQARAEPHEQSLEGAHAAAAAVTLEAVSRAYPVAGGAPVQALANLSLQITAGEIAAVVGPSGCGKSTLLELICGLQAPDSGALRSDPAVLMPQRDLLLPWLDASENAALPLRIAGTPRRLASEQAAAMFAEVGLEGFERSRPQELSGGMRQRVAFLRTLLAGKPVLCLDEPFGALDAITRGEMQEWLVATISPRRQTVLLVTHDVEEAVLLSDRLLVLSPRPGCITADLPMPRRRPRRRSDPEVVEMRERVLGLLARGRR
jgi:ABC-type nitrate/sulfonate/bicarbonate transport system ATPase subunit